METKTKKTTMIGAALAVAIVALAGAGYALSYTATTSNSNNDLTATYIELQQDGTAQYDVASFLKPVYFNTVDVSANHVHSGFNYTVVKTHEVGTDSSNKTTYTENETQTATQTQAAATHALAGKDLTLKVKNVGASPGTLTLVVAANTTAFKVTEGLDYTMIIGTETPGENSTDPAVITADYTATFDRNNKTWTFEGLTVAADGNVDWNLFLFVSNLNASTTVAPDTGFKSTGVEFTFTLTASP